MFLRSAHRIAKFIAVAGLAAALLAGAPAHASDFSEPWKIADRALVIDAYEYNPIDWQQLTSDERIVGFINKGSDGLAPAYRCSGDETEYKLCKALWKRHAVARELFHTRRVIAKTLGLKWGAYHLARPGNPIEQADNFIDFADPQPDDLMALDIEDNDPEKWMSLDDAEEFVRQIHRRTGRFPLLYTNDVTATHIAEQSDRYALLSRLPLWYARYKPKIGDHFPKGHWQGYALWQFAARANCNTRRCPYRPPGTPLDIDVNVAAMDADALRAAWPFGGLVDRAYDTIASVPVPMARETALKGDATLQFASVEHVRPASAFAWFQARRREAAIVDDLVTNAGEQDFATQSAELAEAGLVDPIVTGTAGSGRNVAAAFVRTNQPVFLLKEMTLKSEPWR